MTSKPESLYVPKRLETLTQVGKGVYGAVYKLPAFTGRVVKVSHDSVLDHDTLMEMLVAEYTYMCDLKVSPTVYGTFVEPEKGGRCGVVMKLGTVLTDIELTLVHLRDLLRTFVQWRAAGMYHGDIKVSNFVVIADEVRVIDWGRGMLPIQNGAPLPANSILYSNAFRAPELFMVPASNHGLDKCEVFAMGMTILDLYVDHAVGPWPFVYASKPLEQVNRCLALMGSPEPSCALYACPLLQKAKPVPEMALVDHAPIAAAKVHPQVLELLTAMLQFDPKARMSSEDVGKHPFVTGSDNWKPVKVALISSLSFVPEYHIPASYWTAVVKAVVKVCSHVQQWHFLGLALDLIELWTAAKGIEPTSVDNQRTLYAAIMLAAESLGYSSLKCHDEAVHRTYRSMLHDPAFPSMVQVLQRCVQLRASELASGASSSDVYVNLLGMLTAAVYALPTHFLGVRNVAALASQVFEAYTAVTVGRTVPKWIADTPFAGFISMFLEGSEACETGGTGDETSRSSALKYDKDAVLVDTFPCEVELQLPGAEEEKPRMLRPRASKKREREEADAV